LISHTEGDSYIEGASERGAEGNIWT